MNVTQITPEDKLINAITKIKRKLLDIPTPNGSGQLKDPSNLRSLLSKHREQITPSCNNNTTGPEINEQSVAPYEN